MKLCSFLLPLPSRAFAVAVSALLVPALAHCGEVVRLAKDPALSPDGETLAFAWRGDIWTVPVKGGTARRLTQHPATESGPAFSPDGKQIAFTSDREGGPQVYLMPAKGGEPRQATWHTEGYQIAEWFPDGKALLVNVTRDHYWTRAARLARLDVTGRKAEQVLLDDYGTDGAVSPDGRRVLFTREGEVWWRQGYHGSRAGQIWLLNLDDGSCRQIKAESTECRWPLWKPDGTGFYYVSGRDGVFNLWEHDLSDGRDQQRTFFKKDSVVFSTLSRDGGTLVFRHQFDFYRWKPGETTAPQRISIRHVGDATDTPVERLVLERATSVAFTQDGLQMAFIADGDVWVMDTELREPRQVTRTAEEERDIAFAPDGKSLWFVGDAGGRTDIWKAAPENARKFWWENTVFPLTRITDDDAAESRLQFSRDGKRLAYLKERGDLWIADGDGQNPKRLLESWSTSSFDFSPDGQWIVYALSDEWFNSDIWLLPVDGSRKPFNLSRHPNNDYSPAWSPDGKTIAWTGKREGDEVDIYYVWLRAEDDEQTRRERILLKAREKITKAASTPSPSPKPEVKRADPPAARPADAPDQPATKAKEDPADKPVENPAVQPPAKPKAPPMRLDLAGIHERIRRVAIPNTAESGILWSPDSKKLAFAATVDGKRGTYTVEFPDDLKPKLLVPSVGTHARWIRQGDQVVCLSEGVPASFSSKGTVSNFRFRAPQTVVRADRQRAVFDLCWRIMRDQYYDERLGNRDWNAVRAKYADMAGAAPDMRAVVEVVQLMLGELNGSHLGFSLNSAAAPANTWREETAHTGLRFEPGFAGPGWKVRDVLPGGPAGHRLHRILPGEIVLRVDGREVFPGMDVSEVLSGPPERDITLSVQSTAGTERDVTLRPISYNTARKLLYDQWIKDNRKAVAQLSGGTLGYLHISAMSEASFHRFQEELFAAGAGKDGLMVDVRENGGGSTADHLLTALTQPRHAITVPRGGVPGYPQDRMVFATWEKPIVVLCNQNSYSNAEIFSHAVKTLKRGQLVGVPTAGGVISTRSTGVMNVGTLRLPFRGWFGIETGLDMELNGAVPDHVLWPQPGDMPKGVDTQLRKAVEVLKADVAAWKQRPQPRLLKASERAPNLPGE